LEQRKIAWVNWKIVCLPRDKGGLGIKDLRAFNTALLAKWKWELFQKHGDLWSRILISKYGGWRALDDTRRSSHLSSWWKGLLQLNHQQHTTVFKNQTEWRVTHENWFAVGVRARRWKCWWVALTWTIWKHRNWVVFDNQPFDGSKVMDNALFLLWSWLKVMEKGFTMHFCYWSSHLKVVF